MAYTRKTEDEWAVQGYYDRMHGWEDVAVSDRDNEPQYPHRLIKRRVRKEI